MSNIVVYEVIKDCSISYTDRGEDHSGFALYVGDFLFIKPDFVWIKKESRFMFESAYSRKNLLSKIYHNKLVTFGDKSEDTKYEWTWIENINIVEPLINNKFEDFESLVIPNPFVGHPILKNVTMQWKREDKLNKLLK